MQCNWQRARKSSDWQSKQRDVTCVHCYMVGGPDDSEERTVVTRGEKIDFQTSHRRRLD